MDQKKKPAVPVMGTAGPGLEAKGSIRKPENIPPGYFWIYRDRPLLSPQNLQE